MKKILNFFLLLTIFIISCKTSNILYDRYNGDIISIIKILGKDYKVKTYIVNQNYEYLSEIEPDYFMYFTEDEMKRDVIVYEYIWKKNFRLYKVRPPIDRDVSGHRCYCLCWDANAFRWLHS